MKYKPNINLIRLSRGVYLRILQFIFFIFFVIGIFFINYERFFIVLCCFLFFQIFAVNIGLHRYFCHQSFKTHKFFEIILAIISTLVGQGSIITWSAQHLYHHDHSDTSKDIHSPHFKSLFYIFFSVWTLNISQKKYVKHLFQNKFILFLHKYYIHIHILYSCLLLILNPVFFIYGYATVNILCLMSVYSLVTINHWHGYQTYSTKDFATNSWISNILTVGEGWHNNHHYKPNRFYQGELWWEWDIPALIIKTLLKNKN